MAKDIGKSASGLKEVADSFSDGLKEGTVEADKLKIADPVVEAEVKEKVE